MKQQDRVAKLWFTGKPNSIIYADILHRQSSIVFPVFPTPKQG
uniref:Uncharacterized protein n=1 Tax=Setaria italica TaxID=4555 RepID=K3YFF8_SETIT